VLEDGDTRPKTSNPVGLRGGETDDGLRYDPCPNTVDLHREHVLGGVCSSEGFSCGRVDHASHKYPIITRGMLVYIISIDYASE
jgi:hypothetical protein